MNFFKYLKYYIIENVKKNYIYLTDIHYHIVRKNDNWSKEAFFIRLY